MDQKDNPPSCEGGFPSESVGKTLNHTLLVLYRVTAREALALPLTDF